MMMKLQELAIKKAVSALKFKEKVNKAVKKAAIDTQGDILQFLGIMVIVLILLAGLAAVLEAFFPTVYSSITERIKTTFRMS